MKKNLIILISILLIICAFVVYFVINYRNMQMQAQINNKEYNTYKRKNYCWYNFSFYNKQNCRQ